jgi:hypothetical protein
VKGFIVAVFVGIFRCLIFKHWKFPSKSKTTNFVGLVLLDFSRITKQKIFAKIVIFTNHPKCPYLPKQNIFWFFSFVWHPMSRFNSKRVHFVFSLGKKLPVNG